MQTQSIPPRIPATMALQFNTPLKQSRIKTNAQILEYMESFKNSEGKYLCNYCNRSYLHFKHLKRHFMKHTGNRPHVCNICQDTFCRSDILKRHYSRCLNKFKHTGKCSNISRVPKRLFPPQVYGSSPVAYTSFPVQTAVYPQSFPIPVQYYPPAIQQNCPKVLAYNFSQVPQVPEVSQISHAPQVTQVPQVAQITQIPQVPEFNTEFPLTPAQESPAKNDLFTENTPQPPPDSTFSHLIQPYCSPFPSYQTGSVESPNSVVSQFNFSPTSKNQVNPLPVETSRFRLESAHYETYNLASNKSDSKPFQEIDGNFMPDQKELALSQVPQSLVQLDQLTPPPSATGSFSQIPIQSGLFYSENKQFLSTTAENLEQAPSSENMSCPFPSESFFQDDESLVPNKTHANTTPNFVSQVASSKPLSEEPATFNNHSIPSPPITEYSSETNYQNPALTNPDFSNMSALMLGYAFDNSFPLPFSVPSPNTGYAPV